MSTEALQVGSHVKVQSNPHTNSAWMAGRYGYIVEMLPGGELAKVEFTGKEFGNVRLCDLKVQHHVYEEGVAQS